MTRTKKSNALDAPLVIGFLLAFLGGAAAIGMAVYFSHSASPLWAIILLIWGMERIRSTDREYVWKPTVLGLIIGVAYAVLGVVGWYVNEPRVLWAMILVNWLADAII